jgi:hypothetical protein
LNPAIQPPNPTQKSKLPKKSSIINIYQPTNQLSIAAAAMGREDQVEEREVLESIFPEEITGMHAILS